VILPASIADQRSRGTYDFTWSLPVPRSAAALSSMTVATVASLPAVVATVLVATWRYDVDLRLSWAFVAAVTLTALMTSSVGYGLGHAVKDPLLINLIGNLTIFFVLLFSPIVFPPEQLPGWLQAIHLVLPFQHMAATLRAGLTEGSSRVWPARGRSWGPGPSDPGSWPRPSWAGVPDRCHGLTRHRARRRRGSLRRRSRRRPGRCSVRRDL
jgi:ABC-type multidrug transport system permease subunit